MTISNYLIQSGISVSIITALYFLFKDLIKRGLINSIDHFFNRDLESYKALLAKEKDESIEILKSELKSQSDKDLEGYKNELKMRNDLILENHKSELRIKQESIIKNMENQQNLNLENVRLYLANYSQKQFELYNDLWISLIDLKYSIDTLWFESASEKNLWELVDKLKEAKIKRLERAILLEQRHYDELEIIFNEIERFRFGKENLIDLRRSRNNLNNRFSEHAIERVINENGRTKERFDNFLDQFKLCIQRQIKGANFSETMSVQ